MPTIELIIPAPEDVHDALIALIADDIVQGFEQRPEELAVFYDARDWSDDRLDAFEDRCRGLVAGRVQLRRIADRNWNREWEASIRPIRVGRFVVRPSWAENVDISVTGTESSQRPSEKLIELVIDPKMSFGTAWHESTRLLLRSIPGRIQSGDRVLDAGTGTGILAIAALKLGAHEAVGFDIDSWALQNAPENAALNGVHDRFEILDGTIDMIGESERFDVALANINRDVLLELIPGLMQRAPVAGLSGLLGTDRGNMLDRVRELGLDVLEEREEGEWWSLWITGQNGARAGAS